MKTVTVEIKNDQALTLLESLESMHIIKIVRSGYTQRTKKNSERFSGAISKETAQKLKKHIANIREEWERDI
ncbi:hypothetical protein SAMN05444280_11515 [Tangfeifania diversioriginum]|uniref:Uncharacterized protein n=2 Tax=Tangfeifania diversioriginum TaxID=1168035 RepID=A0A1M6HZC4_9BACT|nr:hypothetical protein SAMN05444280_11515 [Tangfeifania diversioriginum]